MFTIQLDQSVDTVCEWSDCLQHLIIMTYQSYEGQTMLKTNTRMQSQSVTLFVV